MGQEPDALPRCVVQLRRDQMERTFEQGCVARPYLGNCCILRRTALDYGRLHRPASWRGANDIWYSDDGRDWYPYLAAKPWPPRRVAHSSIVFNDQLLVLAGSDGDYFNDVWALKIERDEVVPGLKSDQGQKMALHDFQDLRAKLHASASVGRASANTLFVSFEIECVRSAHPEAMK